MATKTFEELKQLAIQIRDEKTNKANTATRIGTQMIEHLNKLEQEYYNIQTVDGLVSEYNVSVNHPTSGIDGSNKYTLSSAIALVPEQYRSIGIKCSFVGEDGQGERWEYLGVTWSIKNFKKNDALKIDALEKKIQVLYGASIPIEIIQGYTWNGSTALNYGDKFAYMKYSIGAGSRITIDVVGNVISSVYLNENKIEPVNGVYTIDKDGFIYINYYSELKTFNTEGKYIRIISSVKEQERKIDFVESNNSKYIRLSDYSDNIGKTYQNGVLQGGYSTKYIAFSFDVEKGQCLYMPWLTSEMNLQIYYINDATPVNILKEDLDNYLYYCPIKTTIYCNCFDALDRWSTIVDNCNVEILKKLYNNFYLNIRDNNHNLQSITHTLSKYSGNIGKVYQEGVLKGGYSTKYIAISFKVKKGDYVLFPFINTTMSVTAHYMGADGAVDLKNIAYTKQTIILCPEDATLYCNMFNALDTWGEIIDTCKVQVMSSILGQSYIVSEKSNNTIFKDRKILHIGTSIPEGSTYPINAANNVGCVCYNKAIGESKIAFDGSLGKKLSMTHAEVESLCSDQGIVDETEINKYKSYSYESVIIPYIDGTKDYCDTIMFDHGYNDGLTKYPLDMAEDDVDWTSNDRADFFGAFKYLWDKILTINPHIKIFIIGYFENQSKENTGGNYNYNTNVGAFVCHAQELLAKHYNLPLIRTWEKTGLSKMVFIPGTSDFINQYNQQYGKSYTKLWTDSNGNISTWQYYMPDGVHPHSDKQGIANKLLDRIFTNSYLEYL